MLSPGTIAVIRAKLHDIRVTDSDLDYQGSVTLDPQHCEAVGIVPLEFVEIWNKHSGARISTYVIWGERGSGCCVLNGAAARTCQPGDAVIIVASTHVLPAQIASVRPRVALMDQDNRIARLLEYRVGQDAHGRMSFRIALVRARAVPGRRTPSPRGAASRPGPRRAAR